MKLSTDLTLCIGMLHLCPIIFIIVGNIAGMERFESLVTAMLVTIMLASILLVKIIGDAVVKYLGDK